MATIGGIADDYTGATDLATTLVSRGYRTALFFGVPSHEDRESAADFDAVIVGLKTRSAPPEIAIAESLAALQFLRLVGCSRFYDKYCATFDSTPDGNIGPVLDALINDLGVDRTIVSPAFPEAGRTVYKGYLLVDDLLLEETSMRHHPLTPMTDSKIIRLLSPQTNNRVESLFHEVIARGMNDTRDALSHNEERVPKIFIVDAIERADLDTVAAATSDWLLVSGGAGLAASFAPIGNESVAVPTIDGHKAILSGSASRETQAQVALAKEHFPSLKLSRSGLETDFANEINGVVVWAGRQWVQNPATPAMIYSVEAPEDVVADEHPGSHHTAMLMERAFGAIAAELSSIGMTRVIVAGGETSGAVTKGLGIRSFRVGHPISPGTAWALGNTPDGQQFNVLLKSGSLGSVDLLVSGWDS